MTNEKKLGFTLIELLVGIAIVAILASIAYPSYLDFVQSSNRSEAQRDLLKYANLQEQYFVDHRVYTNDMRNLEGVNDPHITEHGWYKVDATVTPDGQSFLLTATAQGTQASDTHCATLSVDHTGRKTATNSDCWQ